MRHAADTMANRFSIVRLLLLAIIAAWLAVALPGPVFDIVSPAWADDHGDDDDDDDDDDEGGGKASKGSGGKAGKGSGGKADKGSGGKADKSGSAKDTDNGGKESAGTTGSTSGTDSANSNSSEEVGSVAADTPAEPSSSSASDEGANETTASSPPAENDDDPRRGLNFFAGFDAYEQGDYDIATEHWLPLAEYGHARSQAGLGAIYYNSAMFADAFRWSRSAARQGDRDAAHNLAVLYQYGLGTPFSMSRAMFWYGEAASHGHRKATLALLELRGESLAAYLVPAPIPKPDRAERQADVRLTEEAQILLATLGYDPGPIDGRYGGQTKAAVEQFERDHGLFIRGRVNETLLTNLRRAIVDESVTTISSNSAG